MRTVSSSSAGEGGGSRTSISAAIAVLLLETVAVTGRLLPLSYPLSPREKTPEFTAPAAATSPAAAGAAPSPASAAAGRRRLPPTGRRRGPRFRATRRGASAPSSAA